MADWSAGKKRVGPFSSFPQPSLTPLSHLPHAFLTHAPIYSHILTPFPLLFIPSFLTPFHIFPYSSPPLLTSIVHPFLPLYFHRSLSPPLSHPPHFLLRLSSHLLTSSCFYFIPSSPSLSHLTHSFHVHLYSHLLTPSCLYFIPFFLTPVSYLSSFFSHHSSRLPASTFPFPHPISHLPRHYFTSLHTSSPLRAFTCFLPHSISHLPHSSPPLLISSHPYIPASTLSLSFMPFPPLLTPLFLILPSPLYHIFLISSPPFLTPSQPFLPLLYPFLISLHPFLITLPYSYLCTFPSVTIPHFSLLIFANFSPPPQPFFLIFLTPSLLLFTPHPSSTFIPTFHFLTQLPTFLNQTLPQPQDWVGSSQRSAALPPLSPAALAPGSRGRTCGGGRVGGKYFVRH